MEKPDIVSENNKIVANCNDLVPVADIEKMILTIRGVQVMLDRDLAMLYGVSTSRLNEQVKRNIKRFPDDFMFQLAKEEFEIWKSQFATSNSIIMGARKRPYAFTANGIAMLSSVLRSETAVEVNIRIVLFDNYVDDTVLTMLDKRRENVSATIFTKAVSSKFELDLVKHNAQYRPIEVKVFDKVHDRFLCIDSTVYHIGASLKDLGKKWFAFSKMEMGAEELLMACKTL